MSDEAPVAPEPEDDSANDNKFFSEAGNQPWFFVPDTGSGGGSAVTSGPEGDAECVETQVTTDDRVGFRWPHPFGQAGVYTMTVTQDDQVIVYEVTVAEPSQPATAEPQLETPAETPEGEPNG